MLVHTEEITHLSLEGHVALIPIAVVPVHLHRKMMGISLEKIGEIMGMSEDKVWGSREMKCMLRYHQKEETTGSPESWLQGIDEGLVEIVELGAPSGNGN